MNETEKTENEKSSYPKSSIREDLSSAESRSGSRDDEVHSGVDRANVKVKISQVAGYVWQTLQAVSEMGVISYIKEEIKVVKERDPAIKSDIEVLLYPSFKVMLHYRIAHKLYLKKHYFLARWVSQRGVRKTGIEIHPGATIGKGLFIDHGSGVIIGETAILGDNITLYQGVTLGGTGKEQGKRHPTLEDNVMVSAGAKVIGSFTIGKNSKIGAGSVVIEEVPPNCTVVGVPGRIVKRDNERVPSADLDQIHLPDPVLNDIRQLQTDNIRLKKELKALKEKLAKEKIIEEA